MNKLTRNDWERKIDEVREWLADAPGVFGDEKDLAAAAKLKELAELLLARLECWRDAVRAEEQVAADAE